MICRRMPLDAREPCTVNLPELVVSGLAERRAVSQANSRCLQCRAVAGSPYRDRCLSDSIFRLLYASLTILIMHIWKWSCINRLKVVHASWN